MMQSNMMQSFWGCLFGIRRQSRRDQYNCRLFGERLAARLLFVGEVFCDGFESGNVWSAVDESGVGESGVGESGGDGPAEFELESGAVSDLTIVEGTDLSEHVVVRDDVVDEHNSRGRVWDDTDIVHAVATSVWDDTDISHAAADQFALGLSHGGGGHDVNDKIGELGLFKAPDGGAFEDFCLERDVHVPEEFPVLKISVLVDPLWVAWPVDAEGAGKWGAGKWGAGKWGAGKWGAGKWGADFAAYFPHALKCLANCDSKLGTRRRSR